MFKITESEREFLDDLESKDFDCRRCTRGCEDCPLDIFCDTVKIGPKEIKGIVDNLKKKGIYGMR